jgi:Sap, sulfolipid-1-addressing protein
MMWALLVVAGLGMAIDPVRLGLAVVMLGRRRPMLNLFAFWLGGIVSGVAIATIVLLGMRDAALAAIRAAASAISEVRAAVIIFSGPRLMITVGVLSLVILAVMLARERAAARVAVGPPTEPTLGGGNTAVLVEDERPKSLFARLGARTQDMLSGDALWPAFVVGAASTFPPYEGVVLLTFIMASGTGIFTQFSVFIVFTFMVLAVIEIPLVSYLVRPEKTLALMLKMQAWLLTYRLKITQAVLGIGGVVWVTQGVAAL